MKTKGKSSQNRKRNYTPRGGKTKDYRCDQEGKMDDKREGDKRLSPLNDFSWYNRNPYLTVAAGSLPYPYRPGMAVDIGESTSTKFQNAYVPGVMSLAWIPTIGQARYATDPAAIAGKEIYAQVRNSFSGSLDADAPDFIIYFLALDSIFSYIGSLKRIYRVLTTYTPMNYDIPDRLLRGLGITQPDSWRANRMTLFQYINELVGMTKKFKCPAVFDLFNRHYWMNDNVYADSPSANAQMYCFRQHAFYKFTMLDTPESVSAGGVSLNTPTLTTVEAAFTFGKGLIDALAGSDDAYTISGYLTRAYEGKPIFGVDEIGLNEPFNPVYVPEVLAQIENSMSVQSFGSVSLESFSVSQDPKANALISVPKVINVVENEAGVKPFISIRSDTPTVQDTVEATRLKAYVAPDGSITCGTECPMVWTLYMNGWMNKTVSQTRVWDATTMQVADIGPELAAAATWLAAEQFDWHPLGVVYFKQNDTTEVTTFTGDIHNVTTCGADQLANLHKVCLYSEFNSFGLQE